MLNFNNPILGSRITKNKNINIKCCGKDTTILCIDSAPPIKTDEDKSWTITIGEGYMPYFWCHNYNYSYSRCHGTINIFRDHI